MRLPPMIARFSVAVLLCAGGLALVACDKPDAPLAPPTASAAAPQPVPRTTAAPPIAAPVPEQGPSTSRDPRRVVIAWARAMSLRDWPAAYRYWGDQGARSGLSLAEFSALWAGIADPQFDISEGRSEGAAGSLYYTAPITLIDGKRRVPGAIVLRRTNNVPGASEEQLRWHIDRLDLRP